MTVPSERYSHIRHGRNQIYKKSSIQNWDAFKKYLFGFTKPNTTFDDIDKNFADRFSCYLDGQGIMPSTINKQIECFRKLCNIAAEYGINKNATSLKAWKVHFVSEEEKQTEIYLTNDELDAIYRYPLYDMEEQSRDLFILGYLCCQRYGDYSGLEKRNFTTTASGTPVIKLTQQKTGNKVIIPIMNPKVFEICEKYNYDFPAIRDKRFNETLQSALKKIAQSCPSLMDEYETVLTHNEVRKEKHYLALRGKKNSGAKMNKEENRTLKNLQLYADEHEGKPLFKRDKNGHVIKFKYEMVTSHTARRSGVTNMYLDGVLDTREMMSISGHKTENIFSNYIRVTQEEQADRIAAKLSMSR